MYAFAIWDESRQRMLLARDRLGIKPLYYSWDGARLIFGSELKAVIALMGGKPAIDEDAALDYLTYGYVPHDRCAVAGVAKLPAGHQLTFEVRTGRLRVSQYWDAPYSGEISDPGDAVEGLQGCLAQAVGSHLVSDVPLGLFLSGGLDSSTILSEMRSHNGSRPQDSGSASTSRRRASSASHGSRPTRWERISQSAP